jgi:predicted RNA binding protein YcfA (HicA-like mRNA interferase family)
MKPLSGKELCKLLEQHGWRCLRTQGSHFIYGKPGSLNRLSVPVHGNRALKLGLQRHLLKMAGLTEEDL